MNMGIEIVELLLELQRDEAEKRGMAVLLITHDLNLVRHFAQRIAVMEQGVLVESGSVEQVFESPQHPYTQRLLASRPAAHGSAGAADLAGSARSARCLSRFQNEAARL